MKRLTMIISVLWSLQSLCVSDPGDKRDKDVKDIKEDKEWVTGRYLLKKFESLIEDAKFVEKNIERLDPNVLQFALEDLRLRLGNFDEMLIEDKALFLGTPTRGRPATDAARRVVMGIPSQLLFLTQPDTSKPGFKHDFSTIVVDGLELMYDRLLFLNGEPSFWMGGRQKEGGKTEEKVQEPEPKSE